VESDEDTMEESKEINMEVGIEDYLNIKMHFPKNIYLLNDVIHGQVLFSQIKLLIKKMDLNIVRKEILGSGKNSSVETTDVNSFEIMDGCPIKGKFAFCK
jgi:vacuolar protein sorting-associated protein 26